MADAVGSKGTLTQTFHVVRLRIVNFFVRFLDGIWHILWFLIFGVFLVTIFSTAIYSVVTTGILGISDPTTWVTVRLFLANPWLGIAVVGTLVAVLAISYTAHKARHKVTDKLPPELIDMYNLGRLQAVSPTPRYISQYRPFYLPRRVKGTDADADQAARLALRSVANTHLADRPATKLGICITGRRLAGKTRLAWQAMKTERALGSWILVDWPIDAQLYPKVLASLEQQHKPVILWLDNLGKYLHSPDPGVLRYLPRALADRKLNYVIVATYDDNDSFELNKLYGDELLSRLETIEPADITSQEASQLVQELSQSGPISYTNDQFDGTPGSIVYGVTKMRDETYPKLPENSKKLLRTIKLLHSVGISDLPTSRVLRSASDLFAQGVSDWTEALSVLSRSGFVNLKSTVEGGIVSLDRVQEVYLAMAVPDYGESPRATVQDWAKLEESLANANDARALLRLASAYKSQEDYGHAETTYRAALRDLHRDSTRRDWALGRLGLAMVIANSIDEAHAKQQLARLEEARIAFGDALTVITAESDPNIWAEAQSGSAAVTRLSVRTTQGPKKRIAMLDAAAANCRAALRILNRESSPEAWAEAQLNLALILQTHAGLANDARARRTMLDTAIAAHGKALEVFTEGDYENRYARVQRSLGDAFKERAASSTRKAEYLQEAVSAYTKAAAILGRKLAPAGVAEIQSNLGTTLSLLAPLRDVQERVILLSQAAEAFGVAAIGYTTLQLPNDAATAYRDHGIALRQQASYATEDAQHELINLAIVSQAHALKTLGRQGRFVLHGSIHWEMGQLQWALATMNTVRTGDTMSICDHINSARKHCERAITNIGTEPDTNIPTEARKLIREIDKKARSVGCAVPSSPKVILDDSDAQSQITVTHEASDASMPTRA